MSVKSEGLLPVGQGVVGLIGVVQRTAEYDKSVELPKAVTVSQWTVRACRAWRIA